MSFQRLHGPAVDGPGIVHRAFGQVIAVSYLRRHGHLLSHGIGLPCCQLGLQGQGQFRLVIALPLALIAIFAMGMLSQGAAIAGPAVLMGRYCFFAADQHVLIAGVAMGVAAQLFRALFRIVADERQLTASVVHMLLLAVGVLQTS